MTPNTVSPDPATAAPIVVERTYKASPEALWALWTTKEGFESWWGPVGFRADVHVLEAKAGGLLFYDMVADTPEMIAAMKAGGRPASHETRTRLTIYEPFTRLRFVNVIDFLPGVPTYDSTIDIAFVPVGASTMMTVTLHPMHHPDFSKMQLAGFSSQLTKLDGRFGA